MWHHAGSGDDGDEVDDTVDGGVGVDKDVIICHMRHHAGSDDGEEVDDSVDGDGGGEDEQEDQGVTKQWSLHPPYHPHWWSPYDCNGGEH